MSTRPRHGGLVAVLDPSMGAAGSTLVGRGPTLARIDVLLRSAARARGSGLLVEGVAGIGKTSVMRWAAVLAVERGFDVRWATGMPTESDVPFGSLRMLMRPDRSRGEPLAPRLADLWDDHSSTADPAVGHLAPATSGVQVMASELIEHLSRRGRAAPVLVVLDDAQWADSSSVAVVGHLARSVVADRIGVLVSRRVADTPRGDAAGDELRSRLLDGIAVWELGPLTAEESVTALIHGGLSSADAARWATRCGGLPLALEEVGRSLRSGPPDPRTIASVLPDAFVAQVRAQPSEVADAMALAALCSQLSVITRVGGSSAIAALGAAEATGLLTIVTTDDRDPAVVEFRHPLVHAAVLAQLEPAVERDLHGAIARALRDLGDIDMAAVHLAASTTGPEPEAAAALEAMAVRAAGRGAVVEAAQALSRAASLTADPDARARLLTRAADAWFDGGSRDTAFETIEVAIESAVDPRARAEARLMRARMSVWARSPVDAVREASEVGASMRDLDHALAATALGWAASMGYLAGDLRTAVERGRDADTLAASSGDMVAAAGVASSVAWTSFLSGEWDAYDARIETLEPLMHYLLDQRTWAGVHLAEMIATSWVCAERWTEADPLIRKLMSTARSLGSDLSTASTSSLLAALCWRLGRWDEAAALVAPLIDGLDGPPATQAFIRVLVAQITATRGDVAATRELVAQALPVASQVSLPLIAAIGHGALGHLELSLGNDDAALAHLDRTAEITERIGLREPGYFLWIGDHLEALRRVGRTGELSERLDALELLNRRADRRWLHGVIARSRARVANDDSGAAWFDRALSSFEALGMPFEVAQTLAVRGRPGDRSDARRLYLRLGAMQWAQGLADGIDEPRDQMLHRSGVLDQLTAQERNVALAVVSGRTNREIAAELYLSVRTVEHYLGSAYRRLGVKNRTELATTVAAALSAPSPSTSTLRRPS